MRWYRLGVTHRVPDDQFQCFWFALELVASATRSTEKVPDRCPHCRSPLLCETCQTHPKHRPYQKQAIRALISAVDKTCDESTLALLEKTRNSLMHGATLREIEEQLPAPHESIVDTLGKIAFRALIHQFPRDVFRKEVAFGSPSTYVHRTLSGIAELRMTVPVGPDGELDLN